MAETPLKNCLEGRRNIFTGLPALGTLSRCCSGSLQSGTSSGCVTGPEFLDNVVFAFHPVLLPSRGC